MDEIQIHPLILPAITSFLLLLPIFIKYLYKSHENKNPPPSPPKLPMLGNLHQLGSLPHRDLQILARKHGPLMLLHFGKVPVLIVSNSDTAREIMRTHDITFSDRPMHKVHKTCLYGNKDVAFSPHGDYWRQMKGYFVLNLLSNKRVQSFGSIREDETARFIEKINESTGPVDLSKMFSEFSNDGICRVAFGRKFGELENGKKFLVLVRGLSEVLGTIDIGEYIPWLSWINRVNGFKEKMEKVAEGLDEFLESVIEERLKINEEKSLHGENFVDIMLQVYNDKTNGGASIDRDCIKAIILDAFAAGTDTTSIVMEWAMAELLRYPKVMEMLQNEVREIVKHKQRITEDDLERMHYLKAVIKETLRYHPPFPLLLPRIAREDVKIKNYDISAGTMVMINAWALARDSASWDEPEKFMPERFLNSLRDFKGLHFEFIPFGTGRRACPGISFSIASIEYLMANLVHKFNWKLPNGSDGKDLDMSEKPGLTTPRAVPLLAVASKSI